MENRNLVLLLSSSGKRHTVNVSALLKGKVLLLQRANASFQSASALLFLHQPTTSSFVPVPDKDEAGEKAVEDAEEEDPTQL